MDSFKGHSNNIPEIDTITMVKVVEERKLNKSDVSGYICELLEYDGIEGFIPASLVGKKRNKPLSFYVKIGKLYPMMIYNVDSNNALTLNMKIDRNVSKNYNKVFSFLKRINKLGCDIYDIYKIYCEEKNIELISKNDFLNNTILDYMDEECPHGMREKYENISEFYEELIKKPDNIFNNNCLEKEFVDNYLKLFDDLVVHDVVLEKKFLLMSYASNGIDIINNFIDNVNEYINDNNIEGSITSFSCPIYIFNYKTNFVDIGKEEITNIMKEFNEIAYKLGIDVFIFNDDFEYESGKKLETQIIKNEISSIKQAKQEDINKFLNNIK